MVALVDAVTVLLLAVKFALVAPAGTVTLVGTVTAVELSESVTIAPPLGATALNRTVPVEALPPTTLVGLSDTLERVAAVLGVTVSVAICVTAWVPIPPNEADRVAAVLAVTADVFI